MKRIKALFLALNLTVSANAAELLDRIVAVVENRVITLTELHHRTEAFLAQNRTPKLPPIEQLQRQILEQMILESLQLQLAKREGIVVDDEMLKNALIEIAHKNGMDLPTFRQALIAQGGDYKQFVEFVRRQLILSQLHKRLLRTMVEVSEAEIDHFLKTERDKLERPRRYRVGHILIATPENASPGEILKARQKAEELVQSLREGLDFAQTAMALSADRYALKGGDLGWQRPDQLPTIFADIVPKLKKGEVHGPIQSPSGFHIIKLLDVEGDLTDHARYEYHLRHIVIKPNLLLTDEKARTQLEELREKVLEGEDFRKLARLFSEDPTTAPKGGDLGWFKLEELEPELAAVVTTLEEGEVSLPLKSGSGWHLVQLLERREQRDRKAYLRQRAREILAQRKWQEALQQFLEKLRREAHVEVFLDE